MVVVSLHSVQNGLPLIPRAFSFFSLLILSFCINGLANPVGNAVEPRELDLDLHGSQPILSIDRGQSASLQTGDQHPLPGKPGGPMDTLKTILDTIDVMQSEYFVLWQGTWPTGIDWTRAVVATQISATLSSISWNLNDILSSPSVPSADSDGFAGSETYNALAYENLIDHYFQHTSAFWFGEDFISLRMQAYDDMLWVVLEWLESLKFQQLHSELHYSSSSNETLRADWHGMGYKGAAAHRARIFYDLASHGWDTALCGGGMIWSPYLTPYKNAITNELYISASIGMYIYFPGDYIDIPIMDNLVAEPRNPAHLNASIAAYAWLKDSKMRGIGDLYADGFHIRGWSEIDPGTGKCDELNTMIYTYNQGVILSGTRGLWLATGERDYLKDGHELINNVMKSTGWPKKSSHEWQGLGRGGVLEEVCDSSGDCSQNGHTFKGIFFHHLTEFCRPLTAFEERFMSDQANESALEDRKRAFKQHQKKCASYRSWIEHNARAAYVTKNGDGKFGMWWGRRYPDYTSDQTEISVIPPGAVDYENRDRPPTSPFHRRAGDAKDTPKQPGPSTDGSDSKQSESSEDSQTTLQGVISSSEEKNDSIFSGDVNDRGRGRTVETQSGALAVFRALYYWQTASSLDADDYE